MLRTVLTKLHKAAQPILGLGVYSTAYKIRKLFTDELTRVLIADKHFTRQLYNENLLTVNISNMAHFQTKLAQALNAIMNENYKFYQSLNQDQKTDFRLIIVKNLLQLCADTRENHATKITMSEVGLIMHFDLPEFCFNIAFLQQKLQSSIQNELLRLATDRVKFLAGLSPAFRLPAVLRLSVAKNMIFFQEHKQDPAIIPGERPPIEQIKPGSL